MGADLPGLATTPGQRASLISIPDPSGANSYQRLLYEQLWHYGIGLLPAPPLSVGWLWHHRESRAILHIHWPRVAYAPPGVEAGRGQSADEPGALQLWPGVVRFGIRLAAARVFGYRVVWTVHEVIPPDSPGHVHRVAARWLARASRTLIVHDQPTLEACRRLPTASRKLVLIPHPSYVGVYPRRRPGAQVREDLGLEQARFVFLCFGMIRPYKEIPLLLEAFAQTREELRDVALVIAGQPVDQALGRDIEKAAVADPRIKPVLRFVADHEVAELFDAADACVYSRGNGGTTGTLLLSLSLGTPVVAARVPVCQELIGDERAGWLFEPSDVQSLRQTLIRAADAGVAAVKGMHTSELIAGRDWAEIGRRTAEVLLAD
jgi:beta-1,4-mannosyltransferase